MMQIEEKSNVTGFALFELGFRPFFSVAGLFAVIGMLLWMNLYFSFMQSPIPSLEPVIWHAHEMIFGYAMAVVAGFLLTAVGNWTGIPTWRGKNLATLLALWFLARIAWFIPDAYSLYLSATCDVLFLLGLIT
ncbi:MAG: NnrS family protein, partial [Gammaproteobacteria bacterium]